MAPGNVTMLLLAASAGDKAALDLLLPMVYKELRRHAGYLMKGERAGHSLQPTELVHEVFVRFAHKHNIQWTCRAHFFAVASHCMRRILVDHARKRLRKKRGAGGRPSLLSEGLGLSVQQDADVLAVDRALARLARLDATHAEIVAMRFFGGLSVEEVAAVLKRPKRSVEAEWTSIRAWLRRELVER